MSETFVFICSAGHSGSTLLDIMLGSHTSGFSLGEITHLPKNIALNSRCSCGSEISNCTFWSQLITEYGHLNDTDYWSYPYALQLGYINAGDQIDVNNQNATQLFGRKLVYGLQHLSFKHKGIGAKVIRNLTLKSTLNKVALFRYVLKRTGCTFVVDSSKHYLEGLNLYLLAPTKVKVVLLVRDGRAVFYSGLKRGLDPKSALAAWADPCRRATPLLAEYVPTDALVTIHYEDLVTSTEGELERLFNSIGVGLDPDYQFSSIEDRHILNGNRMRFTRDIKISSDREWHDSLSAEMLDYFERNAGDLNRRLGYEK